MRAPGAYMPDMINYTYDIDVYSIWAEMLIYNKSFVNINKKYSVGYVSRRKGFNYKRTFEDIKQKFADKILLDTYVPEVLSSAMGDRVILARSKEDNDLLDIINLAVEKI